MILLNNGLKCHQKLPTPKIINSTLSKKLEHSAISTNVFVKRKPGNFNVNPKQK